MLSCGSKNFKRYTSYKSQAKVQTSPEFSPIGPHVSENENKIVKIFTIQFSQFKKKIINVVLWGPLGTKVSNDISSESTQQIHW